MASLLDLGIRWRFSKLNRKALRFSTDNFRHIAYQRSKIRFIRSISQLA